MSQESAVWRIYIFYILMYTHEYIMYDTHVCSCHRLFLLETYVLWVINHEDDNTHARVAQMVDNNNKKLPPWRCFSIDACMLISYKNNVKCFCMHFVRALCFLYYAKL